MKKNKIMRLASALLVLTLISTCAISGTFAKYVTSDSSEDQARVAKFGVVITAADDSNFETSYATDDSNYSGELSVVSSTEETLVAPGTEGTAISFAITGQPEVAVKVDIDMTINNDVYYGDYYPVVFTLSRTGVGALVTGNLAAIEQYLETYAASAYYEPNVTLDGTWTLNWAWDFDAEGAGTNDVKDTFLGDKAAAGTTTGTTEDGTAWSTLIDYEIKFTVTQVD